MVFLALTCDKADFNSCSNQPSKSYSCETLAIYNVLADWSRLGAKGGAFMYRLGILGFLLSPLVVGAFPNAATAPVVAFSIYAPVQKDSPVHIVGLRYDYPTVEIDLENASDVSVDGIGIFAMAIAPRGCGA